MNGYQKYQKASIEKMSPIKLTIMMYKKCILNMKWLRENIKIGEKKEIDEKYMNTELIISELQLSLNRDKDTPEEVKKHVEDLDRRYNILLRDLKRMQNAYDLKINNDLIEGFEKMLDGYINAESGENDGR